MKLLQKILLLTAILFASAVLFVAGVWVQAQMTNEAPQPSLDEVPPERLAAARELMEKALAARFAGDHRKALAHLEEARRTVPSLHGLNYQTALTYLDLREYDQATEIVRRSLRHGEDISNVHALAAMIALAQARAAGTVETARRQIMQSVQESQEANPLNPTPHYVLAEFYRATGRPDLALASYQKALNRTSKSDSTLVVTVKAGLAGLRKNHNPDDPVLEPEIVDGEAPPEQFFFAAADALLRNDKDRAAARLEQVRKRISPEIYNALLNDPFFQDYLVSGAAPPETVKTPE